MAKLQQSAAALSACLNDGFDVKWANGVIKVSGQTDLTYGIGGVGEIDITKARKGNPAIKEGTAMPVAANLVTTSDPNKWIVFTLYYSTTYQMATFNGKDGNSFSDSVALFSGRLSTRTITDLGKFGAFFPSPVQDTVSSKNDGREQNKISIGNDDVRYSTTGDGGQIAIGTYVKIGLKLNLTNIYQDVENGGTVGWDENSGHVTLAYDRQSEVETLEIRQSDGAFPGWVYNPYLAIDPNTYLGSLVDDLFHDDISQFGCQSCLNCETDDPDKSPRCCGCVCEEGVWLEGFTSFKKRADRYENSTGLIAEPLVDFGSSLESDSDTENEGLEKRVNGRATLSIKEVTVCDEPKEKPGGT
ncbi:hypothetical protein GGR58DRAFT_507966 [Xylaria digitata]|nr:hypothetical protein GGR58DRAFT_507966 [Xylaria digitata]